MKVKKWLLGLVTFAAMVVICAVCAGAEIYGNFWYNILDDGTVEISRYYGSAEKVDIPEKIDGKSVTSIGESTFKDCTNLTSITIPNNVTNIGKPYKYNDTEQCEEYRRLGFQRLHKPYKYNDTEQCDGDRR